MHLAEHASFFTAGVAVWWPLIQPIPMRTRPQGLWPVAYIGCAKFGLAALGLYLTWSGTVLYDYYEGVPRVWGLDAVDDQNAGGAIMMVEQSLTFVIALAVLFTRMLTQSETEELRRERLEGRAEPAPPRLAQRLERPQPVHYAGAAVDGADEDLARLDARAGEDDRLAQGGAGADPQPSPMATGPIRRTPSPNSTSAPTQTGSSITSTPSSAAPGSVTSIRSLPSRASQVPWRSSSSEPTSFQ